MLLFPYFMIGENGDIMGKNARVRDAIHSDKATDFDEPTAGTERQLEVLVVGHGGVSSITSITSGLARKRFSHLFNGIMPCTSESPAAPGGAQHRKRVREAYKKKLAWLTVTDPAHFSGCRVAAESRKRRLPAHQHCAAAGPVVL